LVNGCADDFETAGSQVVLCDQTRSSGNPVLPRAELAPRRHADRTATRAHQLEGADDQDIERRDERKHRQEYDQENGGPAVERHECNDILQHVAGRRRYGIDIRGGRGRALPAQTPVGRPGETRVEQRKLAAIDLGRLAGRACDRRDRRLAEMDLLDFGKLDDAAGPDFRRLARAVARWQGRRWQRRRVGTGPMISARAMTSA